MSNFKRGKWKVELQKTKEQPVVLTISVPGEADTYAEFDGEQATELADALFTAATLLQSRGVS